MATCSICGRELGFFPSITGKKLCPDCNKIELQKQEDERKKKEVERAQALAELHTILTKNLNAKSPDQLKDFTRDDSFRSAIAPTAHSMKDDEKVYVLCFATAKQLKYIKSFRQSVGTSVPVFGLKGWRMHSGAGESTPIYDYVDVGSGAMILTNKNIHLCASKGKPLKIPYDKIE